MGILARVQKETVVMHENRDSRYVIARLDRYSSVEQHIGNCQKIDLLSSNTALNRRERRSEETTGYLTEGGTGRWMPRNSSSSEGWLRKQSRRCLMEN